MSFSRVVVACSNIILVFLDSTAFSLGWILESWRGVSYQGAGTSCLFYFFTPIPFIFGGFLCFLFLIGSRLGDDETYCGLVGNLNYISLLFGVRGYLLSIFFIFHFSFLLRERQAVC